MAVIKQTALVREDVHADGVSKVSGAKVIGPPQGWPDHTLRVFCLGSGGYTPHHQHDWEHVNYITKGKGTLTIGAMTHNVSQGDYAFVPPNTKHQFQNPFSEDFEFICIVPNRGA